MRNEVTRIDAGSEPRTWRLLSSRMLFHGSNYTTLYPGRAGATAHALMRALSPARIERPPPEARRPRPPAP